LSTKALLILLLAVTTIYATLPLSLADSDPFGPITVSTSPPMLLAGIRDARVDVTLTLPREGEADLYDVRAEIVGAYPFYFESNTSTLGRMLAGTSGTASFYFDVELDAIPGVYTLDLLISYREEYGSRVSLTRSIRLKVTEAPEDPFGPLTVDTAPTPLYEGSPFAKINMEFSLATVGLGQVFNVSVLVKPPSDSDLVSGSGKLGTISEGDVASASFILNVSDIAAGEYTLPVYIAYQLTPWSYTQYVSRSVTLWVRPYPDDPFSLISVGTTPVALPAGIRGARIDLTINYPEGVGGPLYNASATLKSIPYFSTKTGSYQAGTIQPGSTAVASFYVDVSTLAPEGQHLLNFEIRFKTWPDGSFWWFVGCEFSFGFVCWC